MENHFTNYHSRGLIRWKGQLLSDDYPSETEVTSQLFESGNPSCIMKGCREDTWRPPTWIPTAAFRLQGGCPPNSKLSDSKLLTALRQAERCYSPHSHYHILHIQYNISRSFLNLRFLWCVSGIKTQGTCPVLFPLATALYVLTD